MTDFSSFSSLESTSSLGSASSHRPSLSDEARCYYVGLPSCPVLVGRSSTVPWKPPTGAEAYHKPKMLSSVGRHPIKEIWENGLSTKIVEHLDSKTINWTSIDVVRIGYVEQSFRPVIVWIGVQPESLSVSDGAEVARSCQEILLQFGILDVDVELRESLVTPLKGPKLLAPTYSSDPVVNVQQPLTNTLGIPISSKIAPWCEGTGGFFIAEGGTSKRLLLVTARHVLFKTARNDNEVYEYKEPSAPRRDVMLLGDGGFKKFLLSIQSEIGDKGLLIPQLEKRIRIVDGVAGQAAAKERKAALDELTDAKEAIEALHTFYNEVSVQWGSQDQRRLGHVVYSPPIDFGCGTGRCTQDFAVIEVDLAKMDAQKFEGNVIDLGTRIPPDVFTRMMYPNHQNAHSFEYPGDRLLRLKGTIPDKEMYNPLDLGPDNEPCLMVIKYGGASGLTIGRANEVRSITRNYYNDNNNTDKSMEWIVVSNNNKPFSMEGDSGAVVVDGRGRIGGIITGGGGIVKDITYVTSINFLMQEIKAKFPNAHLNPELCI